MCPKTLKYPLAHPPPTDHPFTMLRWCRTDSVGRQGLPSEEMSGNPYRRLSNTDQPYNRWLGEISKAMRDHVPVERKDDGTFDSAVFSEFPEGYEFYAQTRGDGKIDYYLFACVDGRTIRFRSPNEFIIHAIPLYDPDAQFPCNSCVYCKAQSRAKSQSGYSRKRKNSTLEISITPQDRPTPLSESTTVLGAATVGSFSEGYSGSLTSMAGHHTCSQNPRVYRKGELVWHHMHPALADSSGGLTIQYWPGIIISSEIEILFHKEPPSHYCAIIVYRANLIAIDHLVTDTHHQIIPFLAYQPPDSITELLLDGSVELISEPHTTKNYMHSTIPSTLENAFRPYLTALGISQRLVRSYSLNPKFQAPVLEQAPQYKEHTFYQGIWWGPERIWMLDLVRLKAERVELPDHIKEQILPPHQAQHSDRRRGLFFLIHLIHEHSLTGVMITGDIVEAVTSKGDDIGKMRYSHHLPAPPPCSEWRKINKSTASFSIGLIAGRYYPGALSHPGIPFDNTLYWDEKATRTPDEWLVAASLGGLERGWICQVEPECRVDDRDDAM